MKIKKTCTILFLLAIFTCNVVFSCIYLTEFNGTKNQFIPNETESPIQSRIFAWESQTTRFVGTAPQSIAIGDVNNDGVMDLVTADRDSNTITILLWNRTKGDWDIQNKSVGNAPSAIAIGDPNNDGFTDIVVSNKLSDNINVLLWNDSSSDWDIITREVGHYPSSVTIGDANNNGRDDIIVTNLENDSISILLWNTTKVDWDPIIELDVGNAPVDVKVGDVTNDGLKEIVTVNELDNSLSILQWDEQSKNWSSPITIFIGNTPSHLVIGDANNDGKRDIIVSNRGEGTINILVWNVMTDYWDIYTKSVGNSPRCVTLGDVNFDGQNDIIATNYADANISILLWDILTNDWIISTEPVGLGPTSVLIGDAKNDGLPEIVTTNELDNNITILLWNTTPGVIAPRKTQYLGKAPMELAVGDVNNNGELDIVAAAPGDNTISLLLWNKSINNWNPLLSVAVGIEPTSVSIGDVNNDGAQDIVVASSITRYYISILTWNKSSNSWNPYIHKNVSFYHINDLLVADVNNDGANDIVVVNRDQSRISLLLWNKTKNDWDTATNLIPTSIPMSVKVGDINNNGYNDIIVAGNSTNTAYIFTFLWNSSINNWNKGPDLIIDTGISIFTPDIAIGDAKNNGRNELVVTNKNKNNVSIYSWNNTINAWIPPIYRLVQPEPLSVSIGDVNNNGYNDIVTSNIGTDKVTVLFWNSTQNDWELQVSYDGGVDPTSVIIADVNNNGENDIIGANPSSSLISILLFNRYPYILNPLLIQESPLWIQNEDFGSFSINLSAHKMDIDDSSEDLVWFTFGLNTSLVTVSNEFSQNNIITFHSVENAYGTDIFELRLKDSHNFQARLTITITINPVNDPPVILNRAQLQQNPIWRQSAGVTSFSIDLSDYEFDVEDSSSALSWFTIGLNPAIATVEGENSTDSILTFYIQGKGTDEFTLVLIDSEGAMDSITITLTVGAFDVPALIRYIIIICSIIVLVVIFYYLIRKWRRLHSQTSSLKRKPE